MSKRRRNIAELLGPEPAKPAGYRPQGGGTQLSDNRQSLVLEQARLARIKADQLEGRLVDVSKAEARWSAAVLDARNALLALPSRLGSRLGLTPAQVAIADAEIRDVLAAMAGDEGAADG